MDAEELNALVTIAIMCISLFIGASFIGLIITMAIMSIERDCKRSEQRSKNKETDHQ